jgi:hypothetical protein
LAVTLLQMRDAAKDLADLVNSPFVPDTTWTRWLNDGIERLYRIASMRRVGAFQTSTDVTLTAASNLIAKPATFRILLGVSLDPTVPSMRRALTKYNFGERDSLGLYAARAYRVIGQNISIEPFQLCAGNYRVHYIAGPTILAADGDPIDTILEPFVLYAETWAAIRAGVKEETDTRSLYVDLAALAQEIDEFFAMMDGDDPSTISDDDERGPSYPWTV